PVHQDATASAPRPPGASFAPRPPRGGLGVVAYLYVSPVRGHDRLRHDGAVRPTAVVVAGLLTDSAVAGSAALASSLREGRAHEPKLARLASDPGVVPAEPPGSAHEPRFLPGGRFTCELGPRRCPDPTA